MIPHVFIPSPDDLLGEACGVTSCLLKRANAIHIEAQELPADTRYEQQQEEEPG